MRGQDGRAPGSIGPLFPCQSMVQPPHWLPMSSAFLPATTIRFAVFESGSVFLSFFSSTSDSRTARRATSRCAGDPKRACKRAVGEGRAPRVA